MYIISNLLSLILRPNAGSSKTEKLKNTEKRASTFTLLYLPWQNGHTQGNSRPCTGKTPGQPEPSVIGTHVCLRNLQVKTSPDS